MLDLYFLATRNGEGPLAQVGRVERSFNLAFEWRKDTVSDAMITDSMALEVPFSAVGLSVYRYPKHVWSPSGGWYAQPANWKANTAIMGLVVLGITAIAFSISAEREFRPRMPEKGRFFPSR